MRSIIDSPEGKAACIKATDEGWPAIAGVDPLLAKKFPSDYGKHNRTTHTAGTFVSQVMTSSGYKRIRKMSATPKGCVARSGELYSKK